MTGCSIFAIAEVRPFDFQSSSRHHRILTPFQECDIQPLGSVMARSRLH